MAEQKRVYKWYLILSIIYSSISIITGIIFFKPDLLAKIAILWGPIVLIWFILNIVMLIMFLVKKVEKVALWLPGLYIFDQIFSAIVGVVAGIIGISKGLELTQIIQSPVVAILGLIFPVIILIIAIKLILRK
jgi:hypothetical protein